MIDASGLEKKEVSRAERWAGAALMVVLAGCVGALFVSGTIWIIRAIL